MYTPESETLLRAIKKADIIIYMHSMLTEIPSELLKGKMLVVYHGGTRYRIHPGKMNKIFNPHVDISLVQTGELLSRGAKNLQWIIPPLNLEHFIPDYSFGDEKPVVGHFLSRSSLAKNRKYAKGTLAIRKVMEGFGDSFEFRTSVGLISWKKNLQRIKSCDIYIESIGQGIEANRNKHDWSITALEACALGCITITNFIHEEKYIEEFGEHKLLVANNEKQLKKVLRDLLAMSEEDLLTLKHKARAWVEEKYSFEAVGTRLRKILGI